MSDKVYTKQEDKLAAMLLRLQDGHHVQNRDLRTWLTATAWSDYEYEVQTQKQLRQELKDKPAAVREYETMIAKANFAYNKGEGYSSRGHHAQAKRSFAKADQLYERALERLQEIVAADPSLCAWFDRDTSWTADSDLALSPTAVPLVVTSRSLNNKRGGVLSQLQVNRDVKIAAVERALEELASARSSTQEENTEGRERLKAFIKKLNV